MNTRITLAAAAAVLSLCAGAAAQKAADPTLQQVTDEYQVAFNKGDAKAILALYVDNAVRLSPDGTLLTGRAAIEKGYQAMFAGGGGTLTIRSGHSQMLTDDVAVIEGSYQVGDASGRYVNTIVRHAGRWKLASVVTIPDR